MICTSTGYLISPPDFGALCPNQHISRPRTPSQSPTINHTGTVTHVCAALPPPLPRQCPAHVTVTPADPATPHSMAIALPQQTPSNWATQPHRPVAAPKPIWHDSQHNEAHAGCIAPNQCPRGPTRRPSGGHESTVMPSAAVSAGCRTVAQPPTLCAAHARMHTSRHPRSVGSGANAGTTPTLPKALRAVLRCKASTYPTAPAADAAVAAAVAQDPASRLSSSHGRRTAPGPAAAAAANVQAGPRQHTKQHQGPGPCAGHSPAWHHMWCSVAHHAAPD